MARWPLGEVVRYDGSTHPLVRALPHYHLVPKDRAEQLQYRVDLRKLAHNRPAVQQEIIRRCSEDVLYFYNTMCWLTEPRPPQDEADASDSLLPFNTWKHQDCVIAALDHYFGRRDCCGDKSRAQGASWIVVALYVRRFLFRKRQVLGFMSKDEDAADDHTDPNSLGWKFDFLFSSLPQWMRPPGLQVDGPNRNRGGHTWRNVLNGSVIKGFAANKTSARSGRATSFFLDEAAFFGANRDAEAIANLQYVTNNRIVASTPNGKGNKFHDLIHETSSWLKFVLDWRDNPDHGAGRYTSEDGKLITLDPKYDYGDYDFKLDGRERSPWYDNECARAHFNMVEIARELDRDYGGSVGRPFPTDAIEQAKRFCREPDRRGRFQYERADVTATQLMKFVKEDEGPLKLWCNLDSEGFPPPGDYALGVDIGAGTDSDKTSNSAIEIFNRAGEQVGEFASNKLAPTKLARISVALCYWFGRGRPTPFLIWEKTGPLGTQYSREIRELGYRHVYVDLPKRLSLKKRKTRMDEVARPGYHTSKTANTLEPLVGAIINQAITLRSYQLVRECSEYEFGSGGDWVHPGAKNQSDGSVSGFNHGDRAVAAGVAIHGLQDRKWLKHTGLIRQEQEQIEGPENSSWGRFQNYRREVSAMGRAASVW